MESLKIYAVLKSKKIKFEKEYKFHPTRRWRFDYAILDKKIAIEYEGIVSNKSRHTNIKGYSKDCEKYNQAQLLGWKVLRYTALNVNQVLQDIETAY